MKKQKTIRRNNTLNWSKDDGQQTRRNSVLKSKRGNILEAGRALLSLSKRSKDPDVKRKARADALYFFNKVKRKK